MDSYFIPADPLSVTEETIKKSRFITYLAHTPGEQASKQFIDHIKTEHPAARHHCWAFVAGAPDHSQLFGFSDDGEPSGTAGKPMLSQLQGSEIGEITAVIVRYYGGVMLGTGGLVKAYGGGVQAGLRCLKRQVKMLRTRYALHCQYGQLAEIERVIARHQGLLIQSDFQVEITLTIDLPPMMFEQCQQQLRDMSRGMLSLQSVINSHV